MFTVKPRKTIHSGTVMDLYKGEKLIAAAISVKVINVITGGNWIWG